MKHFITSNIYIMKLGDEHLNGKKCSGSESKVRVYDKCYNNLNIWHC